MTNGFRIAAFMIGALLCVSASANEPLGRLFFSPAQRSALDSGKVLGAPRISRVQIPTGPRTVTLSGVVTRSDGESAVWVNGRPVDGKAESVTSATVSGTDPAAARLKMKGTKSPVKLRVGQSFDNDTGRIQESYTTAPSAGPIAVNKQRTPSAIPKGESAERGPSGGDETEPTADGNVN
jgi:hypothetical protein